MSKGPDRKRKVRIATDSEIVKVAVKHYLTSGDYNGLPVRNLFSNDAEKDAIRSALLRLVKSGQFTMEFGTLHPNPYVKAFKPPSIAKQIIELSKSDLRHACAYPTRKVLATRVKRSEAKERPFTRRLMLGEPHLEFHAFDLSVLEYYRNDPRYAYETDDIRGSISVHGTPEEPSTMADHDQVLLQTFGFAYDKALNRAVAVFTIYLSRLSPEHQQLWEAKRLKGKFVLHPDYYRNSIIGDWGTRLSVFDAFTSELHHINAMAKLMGKPPLFRHEFSDKPKAFAFLVRPTTKEFNDFVLLLDQMMSDNINKDFFRNDIELEAESTRADGKVVVSPKGTIQLLEQWFQKHLRFDDTKPFEEMMATFRSVRKLRQTPAHKPEDSKFDQNLFREQRELVTRAYGAVRLIRLMLANHPSVRGYEVPELLYKGEIWSY